MNKARRKSKLIFLKQTVFGRNARALYQCECGNVKEIRMANVKRGSTYSCGCLKKQIDMLRGIDSISAKATRLTFVRPTTYRHRQRMGLFLCTCGVIKEISINHVLRGITTSCGCLRNESNGKRNRSHGLSRHPLYGTWRTMIARCYDPNHIQFHDYGGSGVTVCGSWRDNFMDFYNWCILNGWQKGLQIDKDIKGGRQYSPEYCTIVTAKINANHKTTNRYLKFKGIVKTLSEWCDELKLSRKIVGSRINQYGWSVEEALSTPKLKSSHDRCK